MLRLVFDLVANQRYNTEEDRVSAELALIHPRSDSVPSVGRHLLQTSPAWPPGAGHPGQASMESPAAAPRQSSGEVCGAAACVFCSDSRYYFAHPPKHAQGSPLLTPRSLPSEGGDEFSELLNEHFHTQEVLPDADCTPLRGGKVC